MLESQRSATGCEEGAAVERVGSLRAVVIGMLPPQANVAMDFRSEIDAPRKSRSFSSAMPCSDFTPSAFLAAIGGQAIGLGLVASTN